MAKDEICYRPSCTKPRRVNIAARVFNSLINISCETLKLNICHSNNVSKMINDNINTNHSIMYDFSCASRTSSRKQPMSAKMNRNHCGQLLAEIRLALKNHTLHSSTNDAHSKYHLRMILFLLEQTWLDLEKQFDNWNQRSKHFKQNLNLVLNLVTNAECEILTNSTLNRYCPLLSDVDHDSNWFSDTDDEISLGFSCTSISESESESSCMEKPRHISEKRVPRLKFGSDTDSGRSSTLANENERTRSSLSTYSDIGYSTQSSLQSSADCQFAQPLDNPSIIVDASEESKMNQGSNASSEAHSSCKESGSARKRSIGMNCPPKFFYKMTPLDSDGATDLETPRSVKTIKFSQDSVPNSGRESVRSIQSVREPMSSILNAITDEMSGKDLQEIFAMLNEKYENFIHKDEGGADVFQLELEKFLKEGTTWTPFVGNPKDKRVVYCNDEASGDASGELSVDEFESPKLANQTLSTPPNTPAALTHANAHQRRKRTEKRSSLAFIFPSSNSCTPNSPLNSEVSKFDFASNVPSMVSFQTQDICNEKYSNETTYAYCTLPRRPGKSGVRKKKERSKCIPRSVSDGESISFAHTNIYQTSLKRDSTIDSGEDSPGIQLCAPPCTPRNSTGSSSETEHDDDTCNFKEGGGESLVLDEERIVGDGGSLTSEPSDTVWDWDDYKPLQRNEDGPVDNALDGTNLMEFTDDGFVQMDNGSCDSGPSSTRTDNSEKLFVPALPRLPPVGLSQDSDSDLEDICQIIQESQKNLRLSQHLLRQQNVIQQSSWTDLMKTCAKNVNCCKTLLTQLRRLGKESSIMFKKSSQIKDLLMEWQILAKTVREKQPVKDESWMALQSVMQRLGQSLQNIMEHLSSRHMVMNSSMNPIDVLIHEIKLLKDLTQKLNDDHQELNHWICANEFIGQYCPELQSLALGYVLAVERCSYQLGQLEALHAQWLDWHRTEESCKKLLFQIKSKVNTLRQRNRHVSFDDKKIENVRHDIGTCQDCLCRLDSMCNHLTSVASNFLDSNFVFDLKQQLVDYDSELSSLKSDFERIHAGQAFALHDHHHDKNVEPDCASIRYVEKLSSAAIEQSSEISTWRRICMYSWPIQLILIVILCLCFVFFYPTCCQSENNWFWSYGAHLNYVRGPPPT